MKTYRLQIAVGGREQTILIRADYRITDAPCGIAEHIFVFRDRCIAWVPASIVIAISES